MFNNETPLDENLLQLVFEIKKMTGEAPTVKITKDHWILTVSSSWVDLGEVCVSYYRFHKNPFRLWWNVTIFDRIDNVFDTELETVSQVSNSLLLVKYLDKGIPQEVIIYLISKSKIVGMEKAVKSIGKETSFILSLEQMKILGIEEDKGRITGRKFGL